MAYKLLIGITPTKFSTTNTGCVLCGFEENDSRKKTKFNGKVSNLWNRISSILGIPLSSVNVESYICSDRCFPSLKRFDKLQEDTSTHRHHTLKENFVAAPTKSLRHGEDQWRVKSAKRLSYEKYYLKQMSPFDWQKPLGWTVYNFSGTALFLHVFWPVCNFVCLQWSLHLSLANRF